jgi:hypothetical protein
MPTSTNDDPTAAGATNVFLTQRAATAPYRREEVSIQGDENPMKALGFDAAGILRTLSVAQMIEDDPEAARDALGVSVSEESPYATVDTEAQFDAALAAGRSIVLRGEGTGGVITLTGPKVITGRGTVIQGAAGGEEIRFAGLPVDARATTINADDVCLEGVWRSADRTFRSASISPLVRTRPASVDTACA